MIITAESGASKTDWIADGRAFRTKGINFSVMSVKDITSVVAWAAAEIHSVHGAPSGPVRIYFYGAGVVSEEQAARMTGILLDFFPGATVECASDLLAAARALWGDSPGIVAILGTGSNSCSYNGSSITGNVRPGGYILGDEGGGAALGKRFMSDYVKGLVPESLAGKFRERYPLKYSDIVNSVYRGQNPAGFLASFAPFIIEASYRDGYAGDLVRENIRSFITRSLLSYRKGGGTMQVGVAGSIGTACMNTIESLGKEYDIDFCKFITSPIEELAAYHSRKNSIFASGI